MRLLCMSFSHMLFKHIKLSVLLFLYCCCCGWVLFLKRRFQGNALHPQLHLEQLELT